MIGLFLFVFGTWLIYWVMSHIWMSHAITNSNELWMRHVRYTNESCRARAWFMAHISMRHVTHRNESCHRYTWVMSLMLHAWMSTSHMWLGHITHINASYVNEFILIIYTCAFTYNACIICSFMNEACHTYESVMSHIWIYHVTHMNESHHTCKCVVCEWVYTHSHTTHLYVRIHI